MSWFHNLKISVKLILGFSLVAVIAGITGLIGLSSIDELEKSDTMMYENMTVPISNMAVIVDYYQRVRITTRDILLAEDKAEIIELENKINEYIKVLNNKSGEFEKRILSEKMGEAFEEFMKTRAAYRDELFSFIALAKENKREEARKKLNGEMYEIAKAYEAAIYKLVDMKTEDASNKSDANTDLAKSSSKLMMALMLVGVILSLGLGIFIARTISRSLIKGVEFSRAISEGNLTERLDDKLLQQKDEIGVLASAMNNMVIKLTEVVQSVQTASDNVAAGSQELSANSEQMSQGATEQAAAAEEASSSMEQMASNIKQNTDNAYQTEKIALKSAEDAKEGGKAVMETVQAMKDIANKISIIEEIAGQTNLLALNAAIEAARAGEHGKGFAVVAAEVRKLAERSQVAAGEINKLSVSSVQVAEKAGELFSRIIPDIQKTAELVQEISASSAEQNTGVDQINNAMQQLNQVIQQNASSAEEMASTAEELNSQSEQLINTMSFFAINNDEQKTEHAFKRKAQEPLNYRLKVGHIRKNLITEKGIKAPMNGKNGHGIKIDLNHEPDRPEQDYEKF